MQYLVTKANHIVESGKVEVVVLVTALFDGIMRTITLEGSVSLKEIVRLASQHQKITFNGNVKKALGINAKGKKSWTVEERQSLKDLWADLGDNPSVSFANPQPVSPTLKLAKNLEIVNAMIELADDETEKKRLNALKKGYTDRLTAIRKEAAAKAKQEAADAKKADATDA